ncbi:hypothetical protein AB1Y20_010758 [Prymnesium parvum]|uniref:Uncharacterized protein n=1 Tax=Prymnesium parvum TaxID=97485 RepID=A0AB34IQK3_PRYPA
MAAVSRCPRCSQPNRHKRRKRPRQCRRESGSSEALVSAWQSLRSRYSSDVQLQARWTSGMSRGRRKASAAKLDVLEPAAVG